MPKGTDESAEALSRWRLTVAYDGSGFRGFALQPGEVTVAGELARAIGRAVRIPDAPVLVCAGRTDAGVHARGQVVHVDLPSRLPEMHSGGDPRPMTPTDLLHTLNRQLAPSIVVRRAEQVAPEFDARRSATARHYRYLVHNAAHPDPLLAQVAWHVADPLDVRAMNAAADSLVGKHDFRAFCRRPPGTEPEQPITRIVTSARWVEGSGEAGGRDADVEGSVLRFEISAGSFCHQMVRSLVATLVAVGHGKGNVATMVALLQAGSRVGTERPAPPHGLCLMTVDYPST